MSTGKNIREEIAAQKKIVSELKTEIFGSDKTGTSSYIREFLAEFNRYREVVTPTEIIDKALASDIVYFGDYHPLTASQDWAMHLVRELKGRGADVVLALEMLYEYQQETLDRWMKGKITEEEFLSKINYGTEWGFSWESYRRFFETAKDPFVPIFGIDREPRDHLRYIKSRDSFMGRRIASIRNFFPGHIVVAIVGESHLASPHLPSEVRKVSNGRLRELVIVQNMDEIYWKLRLREKTDAGAVLVGDGKYCVFTTSPIIKYQSYRDIIELWNDESVSESVLNSLGEMAGAILDFLIGGAARLRVQIGKDWKEPVTEIFPGITRKRTYRSFGTLLRSRKATSRNLPAVKEHLKRSGICYFPQLNIFLLIRFDPARAAEEAARFVVYAMRGELGTGRIIQRDEEGRFYARILEWALAWTGARVVDPLLDLAEADELLQCLGGRGAPARSLDGFTMAETSEMIRAVKYHLRREARRGGRLRGNPKLRAVYRMDPRKRFYVARTLGRLLGDAIYRGFHGGKATREELLALFRDPLAAEGDAKSAYLEWARRMKGARIDALAPRSLADRGLGA